MCAVISVDLDICQPGIVSRRTVTVGETFIVTIWVEDDGTGVTPTVFDTIVLGVYFNDRTPGVLSVTRTHFPHAGELAGHSKIVLDAFSKRPLVPNMEMALTPVEKRLVEPFTDTAGRAGMIATNHPFKIFPGQKPIMFAAGKVNAGFRASSMGTSTIMACAPRGDAELSYRGQPIFAKTVPGLVTVVEERTTKPNQGPFLPLDRKVARVRRAAKR